MKRFQLFYILSILAICTAKRAYEIVDNEIQIVGPGKFNITHEGHSLEILVVNNAHINGKYFLCVGPASETEEFCPEGYGLIVLHYNDNQPEKKYLLDHHGKLKQEHQNQYILKHHHTGYFHAPVLPEKAYIAIAVPSVLTDVKIYLQNAKIYKPKDPNRTDITKVVNKRFFYICFYVIFALTVLIFAIVSVIHFRMVPQA
uniref:GOLD domain-containing protein n=1 Tax=Panagrellus redivivus TaxID=6233 RepID=A0A7E4VMG3_PANRE